MFCFQVVTGGVLKDHVQGAGGSIQFTVQRPHYVSSVLANIMSPPVASRRKSQKAGVCIMVCPKFWANYYILIYTHHQELYAWYCIFLLVPIFLCRDEPVFVSCRALYLLLKINWQCSQELRPYHEGMSISSCDQSACWEGFGFNLENCMKSDCLQSAYL
jgi:hypothetical protein